MIIEVTEEVNTRSRYQFVSVVGEDALHATLDDVVSAHRRNPQTPSMKCGKNNAGEDERV